MSDQERAGRSDVARRRNRPVVHKTAEGLPADGGTGRLFIDAPDSGSAGLLADQLDGLHPKLVQDGGLCRVRVELDLGDEHQLADVLAGIEHWLQRTGRAGVVVAVNDRHYVVEAPAAAA
jgi:hypothetical protein